MPEFQLIRRSDVPIGGAWSRSGRRPWPASAHLHRSGSLCFSVVATEAFGTADCLVMVGLDEESCILKFTAIENASRLPHGITEEDCFTMRIRKTAKKGQVRPMAHISLLALFRHIGFRKNGSQSLQVVEVRPEERSVSVRLPAEQFQPAAAASEPVAAASEPVSRAS